MSRPTLTGERLAEFLRRYPHEPNPQLAAAFGITVHQAGNIGFNHGVKKTATTISRANGSGTSVAQAVLELIKARGKQGLNRPEALAALPHLRADGICNALRTLAQRGETHQAGRRRQYRWFRSLADALAHNASQGAPAPVPGVAVARQHGPALTAGEAIETARTVRRTCVSPAPPELPSAARHFSAQRPGQYGHEASSWVAAITQR
ncbi:hypothetical protein [Roseateles asaccharophilus]|uniref:Uncharacterized protein n=1 Tax=Roseateles asaccharophilus TaxID=582607 RepID=A0ABU2A3K4_9BURK|nr:hypothetical protein [Roseateles asaccharophilus]MDR7331734.1 hypothetical protein [Roseateles asaccharophilus]